MYELEFEDAFQDDRLDPARWLPYYLPHWSSRERSAARYEVGGGTLRLFQFLPIPWAGTSAPADEVSR